MFDYIKCGDCVSLMKELPDSYIDLTVTSPPYDNLRTYKGYSFEFESVAQELYRITKQGGVVVWVVGDATIKGSETGTSFKQALYFKEMGFNLHDTMIYRKINYMPSNSNRYCQEFEYIFVFSKGSPKTFNPIKLPCKYAGTETWGCRTVYNTDGTLIKRGKTKINDTKIKGNIFEYRVGNTGHTKTNHPAVFPDDLARDQIISWSNEGDIIFDPFVGSGTTAKMAMLNNRHYIGFDISEEYCKIAQRRINEGIDNGH